MFFNIINFLKVTDGVKEAILQLIAMFFVLQGATNIHVQGSCIPHRSQDKKIVDISVHSGRQRVILF